MKKRIALLFVLVMILSCMPVMAGTAPAAASSKAAVTTQAAKKNGWYKVGGYYRYYVNGNYYKNGVYKIGTMLFGFSAKGNLCTKWFTLNGQTYYGSVKQGAKGIGVGQVLTGYRKIGNDYYYLNPSKKGARATGFVTIGKKLYYFNATTGKQRRTKGWFTVNGAMYYVYADGTVATNTTIEGRRVGANGAAVDPYGYDKKAQGYSSNTRNLILVDKTHHYVNIYQGSKGSWVNIRRNMLCTIGKAATPTRSGSYKLKIRVTANGAYGRKDFTGSTAFYAYFYNAGNFFHSIIYRLGTSNPYTATPKDARLGQNKSNGCIRLALQDAKYLWDNMKVGTRVIVY